jgi:hypothetical protein
MSRGTLAAVFGAALLSTAACGSVSQVATGDSEPRGSISSGIQPTKGSACLDTPTTGASTVMVDWVDFVRLDGIQYFAAPGKASAADSNQIGAVVGQVECQLSSLKFHAQPGPSVDGDAAFIRAGTHIHALRGYPRSCRVVARVAGVNRVYLARAEVSRALKQLSCAKTS